MRGFTDLVKKLEIRFTSARIAAAIIALGVGVSFGGAADYSSQAAKILSNAVGTVRSLSGTETKPDQRNLQVMEVSLGKIPNDMQLSSVSRNQKELSYWEVVDLIGRQWFERFAASPDQQHIAFVEKQDGKSVVVVDGKPHGAYDEVFYMCFSPDSLRFGFSATRGTNRFLVVDGVESKSYEPERQSYPIFSPNSQRVAFMARKSGKALMVIDGVEGNLYANLLTTRPPKVFSPDSKRFAYAAETADQKWVVVVDGHESKPVDMVEYPMFSPDSQHVLYKAWRGDASYVVVDGVEGPSFKGIDREIFSPDSKRSAYRAHTKQGVGVVTDGKIGTEYDHVEWGSLAFSPDSKRLAYVAKQGSAAFVVVEGKEGPRYDAIEDMPMFSSDGKHLAYTGSRRGKTFMVLDGTEGPPYWDISAPVFSPDSKRLAYAASSSLNATVVCDGKEGPKHMLGEIVGGRTKVVFSPDSRRMAYRISIGGKAARVVVDGKESKLYESVDLGGPVFSQDSRHSAYWASPFSGDWQLVVDGYTTPKYSRVLQQTRPVFDGVDSLHTLVERGEEILLLKIKIPPATGAELE